LARYLQAGVPVAVGTDNCSMQDDEDLLSELRLAGNLGREADWHGPSPPTSDDLVAMATVNGAKAAQFGDDIGLLEPGRRADLVAFSLDRTRHPYLDPDMPIVAAFLARGRGEDTQMTMVDGRVLYLNGNYTDTDIGVLEAAAANAAVAARSPSDSANTGRTEDLRKRLCDHYRGKASVEAE
jgi:cytosine/adenosine deaminase-related metal-dependent hydrolase